MLYFRRPICHSVLENDYLSGILLLQILSAVFTASHTGGFISFAVIVIFFLSCVASTLPTGSVPSDSNLTHYFRVLPVTTTPSPTTSTTSSTDTLSLWYLYFAIAMAAVLVVIAAVLCIITVISGGIAIKKRYVCAVWL